MPNDFMKKAAPARSSKCSLMGQGAEAPFRMILARLHGTERIMAMLLYGAGLRLMTASPSLMR